MNTLYVCKVNICQISSTCTSLLQIPSPLSRLQHWNMTYRQAWINSSITISNIIEYLRCEHYAGRILHFRAEFEQNTEKSVTQKIYITIKKNWKKNWKLTTKQMENNVDWYMSDIVQRKINYNGFHCNFAKQNEYLQFCNTKWISNYSVVPSRIWAEFCCPSRILSRIRYFYERCRQAE